jgi:Fe-S cluster assembly protein SufB
MANYTEEDLAKDLENQEYKFGFVTNIETEKVPVGLNEDIIRLISSKKNEPEWLLEHRLKAFEIWKSMTEPEWAHVNYKKPNFQGITYYAAPKQTKKYESWDVVGSINKAKKWLDTNGDKLISGKKYQYKST